MSPGPLRPAGQVLGGLTVIACVIAWACWTWLSGAPWRHDYRGRRLLTRPVRAVLQIAVTAVVLGVLLAPVATATVLAALGASLVGSAVAWRARLWLDARAEHRARLAEARPRWVTVQVGRPIPNRPRPAGCRRPGAARRARPAGAGPVTVWQGSEIDVTTQPEGGGGHG